MKKLGIISTLFAFFLFQIFNVDSCSRIFLNCKVDTLIVTRTWDWDEDDRTELWVHPRGMEVDGGMEENSLFWISKYGSIVVKTLDDTEVEGMNEHGLNVNLLYLQGTEYEARDERPGISTARWVRYFLDNFKTVKEAVAGLNQFQVVSVPFAGEHHPIHISMGDATGDSAVLEYLNGSLVVHHGLQYNVMTNDPIYSEQLARLKMYKSLGGTTSLPGDVVSTDRFVRASYYLHHLPEACKSAEAVAYAFALIRTVSIPPGAPYHDHCETGVFPTWWTTVADLTNKMYYFKSTLNLHTVSIAMDDMDFSTGLPATKLNLKN